MAQNPNIQRAIEAVQIIQSTADGVGLLFKNRTGPAADAVKLAVPVVDAAATALIHDLQTLWPQLDQLPSGLGDFVGAQATAAAGTDAGQYFIAFWPAAKGMLQLLASFMPDTQPAKNITTAAVDTLVAAGDKLSALLSASPS